MSKILHRLGPLTLWISEQAHTSTTTTIVSPTTKYKAGEKNYCMSITDMLRVKLWFALVAALAWGLFWLLVGVVPRKARNNSGELGM